MLRTEKTPNCSQSRTNEEAAFKKCITIPACEAYLKRFPNGKHADEVREKLKELNETNRKDKAEQQKEF